MCARNHIVMTIVWKLLICLPLLCRILSRHTHTHTHTHIRRHTPVHVKRKLSSLSCPLRINHFIFKQWKLARTLVFFSRVHHKPTENSCFSFFQNCIPYAISVCCPQFDSILCKECVRDMRRCCRNKCYFSCALRTEVVRRGFGGQSMRESIPGKNNNESNNNNQAKEKKILAEIY